MNTFQTASRHGILAALLGIVTVLLPTVDLLAARADGPVRVDFSLDNGRRDTNTPGWFPWQVPNGQEAALELDGLRLRLRAVGDDAHLEGKWHKAGLATGATMATDGVAAVSEGRRPVLELEISGLAPGKHSLVSYHNVFKPEDVGVYLVSAQDGTQAEPLRPTLKSPANEAAESAYIEFEAEAETPVVVRFTPKGTRGAASVTLNGIEIDGSNPKTKALSPTPADFDLHADGDRGSVRLRWEPARSAVSHEVYAASDANPQQAHDAIEAAGEDSPEHLAATKKSQWDLEVPPGADHLTYCWRVDSVDRGGNVTRGDVWTFRVRQLAFPGAEGYGRFAIGGRGGRVLKVTNLKDSGPGSLRAAIEAEGPRIVVFDVSGRIVLQDRLIIRHPFLTIAGQTAPAKGICLSNYNLGMLGAHDCIIRYLRVRPGDTAGKTLDGMGMASSDHCIIDHCSISWTQDESFSSRGAKNITLQRTLISEALNVAGHKKYGKGKEHGYAASIGGDVGSFHHNLLAHCSGRNWSLAGGVDQASVHAGRLDIRNNVVYNWRTRTTDGGAKEVNFVNNYYKPGPASRVFHVLMPQHELPFGPQEYYVLGNVMEGYYGPKDRYAGVRESGDKPMREYIVERPFFEPFVNTTSAKAALHNVLGDVGCNRPILDDHDKRILEEVRKGETTYSGSVTGYPGLPDSQEDVGGWEDYPEVHRPADWDSDGDGLPDWWEEREGLNPDSPPGDLTETHADPDGDGYTNIEQYLHWMATPGNEVPK